MATARQIEANRLNAQKSTGPRTEDGRRASSRNALKSGLDSESQFIPGESRDAFAQLQAEYCARFAPGTPEERFQVDTLIRSEWILRRLFRVETQLWDYHVLHSEDGAGVELGEAFTKANTLFMRLQRRIHAAEKAYKEAMAELRRLRDAAQPEQTAGETGELASFLTPLLAIPEIPASPVPPVCPSPFAAAVPDCP